VPNKDAAFLVYRALLHLGHPSIWSDTLAEVNLVFEVRQVRHMGACFATCGPDVILVKATLDRLRKLGSSGCLARLGLSIGAQAICPGCRDTTTLIICRCLLQDCRSVAVAGLKFTQLTLMAPAY
jgi:hypothetical protein